MKQADSAAARSSVFGSVKAIGSIFRVRKDLLSAVKKRVLPGSDLALESAELLIALYGAAESGWDDPAADPDGFVTFQDLESSLVHTASSLTRGITYLKSVGWVESCEIHKLRAPKGRIDKRAKAVRITIAGRKKIEPVFAKYCRFCSGLMAEFTAEDQLALDRINEALIARIRGVP